MADDDLSADTDPYRVDLDIYQGPLDLLLYLIRRQEIEIIDIPVAEITDQYIAYMETIRLIEPALAGDFLVMAATLMEIKSRMLLPRPPEEEEDEDLEDPRGELVRQLLAYKQFKDAAAWLADQAEERAERVGRLRREHIEAEQDDDSDLKNVELWDLVEAFGKVMQATLANLPDTIVDEDVPVQVLTEYILQRLKDETLVPFMSLFEEQPSRRHVVGMFLAILELIRVKHIEAEQQERFGEIFVRLRGPELVESPPQQAGPHEPGAVASAASEGEQE